jgi:tetratricopeptide (TPR) repeat protein
MPRYEDEEEPDFADDEEEDEDDDEEQELDELIEESEELVETGQARKAMRLWTKAIDRFADEPAAFYHLGLACLRHIEEETGGEPVEEDSDLTTVYEEGLTALNEATGMEPDDAAAWTALGRLLMLGRKYSEAADCFEKSLGLDDSQRQTKKLLKEARDLAED